MSRPYVVLSVAVSIDGYLDDASPERLLLSNAADFDRVDAVRADSDAILVGAETLRRDNPRLLVNSAVRRERRVAAGKPEYPLKVTVTATGELDPALRFWRSGGAKLVYTTDIGAERLAEPLAGLAEVVSLGAALDFAPLLDDLGARGVRRLMVEGGGLVHTEFLSAGLADELLMAVAPVLVGDPAAPRFLHPAAFPGGSGRRMTLDDVTRIGDIALLRYLTAPEEISGDGRRRGMETPQ
ncbi:dihydrofolate reductase family protein [Nocardia sp. CDC159]|uniref:Dihydrofolate reductase family protein n=1 Tax=Nocardia pulmonis TaxID=2951408 RepID=A0A9X2IZQ8_9NOCA|nr:MULTISPECIES: dihydrofolate reductase family protein [Nocardia]MCM6776949.1 dihydrofolate reductase family protein [Nocardia pulmonis]MCM6789373.1 dihydrofolate reductase family protein [Nocardia sp. CDC159]